MAEICQSEKGFEYSVRTKVPGVGKDLRSFIVLIPVVASCMVF